MNKRYRVIVADPPWKFGDSLGTRGAAAKYKTMWLDRIKGFELPPTAADCVLLLWRVAAMQEEALAVARAWGFEPTKGEIVWDKRTPTGKQHFGMGRIVRGAHESCIIATRGKPLVKSHSERSLFSAPVPRRRGQVIHSAKPDEFFALVRRLFDGPRASLFERSEREGFDCFGRQMRKQRAR